MSYSRRLNQESGECDTGSAIRELADEAGSLIESTCKKLVGIDESEDINWNIELLQELIGKLNDLSGKMHSIEKTLSSMPEEYDIAGDR